MYTTNYTWKSFNPLTARLTVEVNIFWNGIFAETRDISLTLPVDTSGVASTDTGLIDRLINDRIFRYLPDVVNNTRLPPLGVVNAEEIYALTTDAEADEISGGQIMVLLTPNPDFIDVDNMCTRSIITVIYGRNNLSRPFYTDVDPPIVIGIDNGNLSNDGSTGLLRVRSGVVAEQAGAFEILNANDNAGDLPVAAWVYTVYPGFLDGTTVTPEEGFDGYQYYIEHDPIEIDPDPTAITTAVFSY
jgi:hypothetical protein